MKKILLIILLLIVGCSKEPINYESTLVKRLGEGWKIKGTHFSKTSHYGKDLGKIGSYQFILTK